MKNIYRLIGIFVALFAQFIAFGQSPYDSFEKEQKTRYNYRLPEAVFRAENEDTTDIIRYVELDIETLHLKFFSVDGNLLAEAQLSDKDVKFISRDPKFEKYFWQSPYMAFANNPLNYIDPDGRDPIKSPYMTTVRDCFGYGNTPTTPNPWRNIPSVIPQSKFVGWGYKNSTNCYTLANYQLSTVGYSSTSKYYQAYTEQKGVDKNQTRDAIKSITSALLEGKPVMVGVDDADGHPGNADKTTDHWIVIVGMGTDKKGNYFQFYDNATPDQQDGTSPANKLYYDVKSGKITGTSNTNYSRNAQRDYTVTRVKETKKNTIDNNNQ